MASIRRTHRAGCCRQELTACWCFRQGLVGYRGPSWVLLHLPSHPGMLSGPTGVATTPLSTALDIRIRIISTPLPRASSFLLSFQIGIVPLLLGESVSKRGGERTSTSYWLRFLLCGCNLGESFKLPGETR